MARVGTGPSWADPAPIQDSAGPVRIGYFHGGRVNVMYRASIDGFFDAEKVSVDLYTANLHERTLYRVPKTHSGTQKIEKHIGQHALAFGRMTGNEIIDAMLAGKLDGGTIGESSFIQCAGQGYPIVAVALMGHDSKEHPGHAIILRKGLVIKSPADFRGKTLLTRRAGPGDLIFLKEFLRSEGLADDPSIKIISQVPEDRMGEMLKDGSADGGYWHLIGTRLLVLSGEAYIYRPLNWINPELSQALLVFRTDFVRRHPESVQKVVDAYVKRIAYEKKLPPERVDKSWDIGLMMQSEFDRLMIPQYDFPPLVRPELLEQMQKLLATYGVIPKENNLRDFIDNGFVERSIAKIAARSH